MATCSCIDPPMKWDDVISWFKEEMRGKSLKSCLQIMFWIWICKILCTKRVPKDPHKKLKKLKGKKKHMKGGEGAWVFGMLYMTSHIAWEWGCAYMYKCTIYDSTRFKAVMVMNLSELRSSVRAISGWVTSWEVWFGKPKADNIVSLGVGRYIVPLRVEFQTFHLW
jgi:hypothetical protein